MENQKNKIQQCLVIIKPEGLLKSLTGNIIQSLSATKLKIVGAKVVKVSEGLARKHYEHMKNKNPQVYQKIVDHLTGKYHTDRVLALVYQGENAIEKIRGVCGSTNPEEASPTSIRGRYGRIHSKTGVFENVVHASDSEETAEKEIKLWFSPEEIVEHIYPTEERELNVRRKVWK